MEQHKQHFFKKLAYLLDIKGFLSIIGKSNHALLWCYPPYCDIDDVKTQLDYITNKSAQISIRHDLIMYCYYDILKKSLAVQNGGAFRFKNGTKVVMGPKLKKKEGLVFCNQTCSL